MMPNRRQVVVSACAITALVAGTATAAATSSTPDQRVDQALHQGRGAVLKLMHTKDLRIERALLKHAVVKQDGPTPVAQVARIRPGCHRRTFSDRHHIDLPIVGITIGWERVDVHGFCWNGKRITWWGGEKPHRWASFAYCWKDTGDGDYWSYRPRWRTAYVEGTFGGNATVGCVGLQHDSAHIDYANGGGIFNH
jgi:hypothetical protein